MGPTRGKRQKQQHHQGNHRDTPSTGKGSLSPQFRSQSLAMALGITNGAVSVENMALYHQWDPNIVGAHRRASPGRGST